MTLEPIDPVYTEVVKYIVQTLMVDEAKITPTSRLTDDLDATSLDLITIAMDMEKKYGKEVFEDDVKGLVTVADLVKYVRHRFELLGITP